MVIQEIRHLGVQTDAEAAQRIHYKGGVQAAGNELGLVTPWSGYPFYQALLSEGVQQTFSSGSRGHIGTCCHGRDGVKSIIIRIDPSSPLKPQTIQVDGACEFEEGISRTRRSLWHHDIFRVNGGKLLIWPLLSRNPSFLRGCLLLLQPSGSEPLIQLLGLIQLEPGRAGSKLIQIAKGFNDQLALQAVPDRVSPLIGCQ